MEKRNLEQRCAIKFCTKLNENATETYEKLKWAFGEHAVSMAQVFRLHTAFLDGRESVEDEPCSGRPFTSKTEENVTKGWALVRSDRRMTIRMIGTIVRSLKDSEKKLIVSGQRLRTLGCCITTTLPVTLPFLWMNILPKRVFQWFISHHNRLIWVRVASSFSRNSNSISKVVILEL